MNLPRTAADVLFDTQCRQNPVIQHVASEKGAAILSQATAVAKRTGMSNVQETV